MRDQQSCIFVQFIQDFKVATGSTSPGIITLFHTWLYGRFTEIQNNLRRKKLHRINQCSNFLGDSFISRDNIRAPIQFRRESQPQKIIFPQKQTHPFSHQQHQSFRPAELNQLSFSNSEINKPLPAPACSVSQVRFKFRS